MICDMDLKAKKNACKGFSILVRYNKPAKTLNATEINLVLLFKKTDTHLLHEYIHFRQPPEILARRSQIRRRSRELESSGQHGAVRY